jgi:hypothetical protein
VVHVLRGILVTDRAQPTLLREQPVELVGADPVATL